MKNWLFHISYILCSGFSYGQFLMFWWIPTCFVIFFTGVEEDSSSTTNSKHYKHLILNQTSAIMIIQIQLQFLIKSTSLYKNKSNDGSQVLVNYVMSCVVLSRLARLAPWVDHLPILLLLLLLVIYLFLSVCLFSLRIKYVFPLYTHQYIHNERDRAQHNLSPEFKFVG